MSLNALNTATYNTVAANTVDDAVIDAPSILAWRQNVKDVVNQIGTDMGDMATATTTAKTTLGAINELRALLGGKKIQTGSANVTVTAGTAATVAITFPNTFASAPMVFLSVGSFTVNDQGYINLSGLNATATGFTLRVNSYISQTVAVNWIVIGP